MIGQLIHGGQQRRILKSGHMVNHGILKYLYIPLKIFSPFITVFLHSGEKPGNRLHEGAIIHHRIPLVTLQPFSRIIIMLRQNDCFRIRFFYRLSEISPETVVHFLTLSQICRHIQPPAIDIIRRGYPFFSNFQNILV